jgi:hypothetical protein
VARIDPPFWNTPDGKRPAIISDQFVGSPALLNVSEVYKGPAMWSIEVSLVGACFTPSECTDLPLQYVWDDVLGYDLILFLQPLSSGAGPSRLPAQAVPFLTYVVNPDPSKDEAQFIDGLTPQYVTRSRLERDIRTAPTANR